jgi:hypothetical protein
MDLNRGLTRAIIEECKRQGLLRNQVAYVLASCSWETNHTLRPVEEAYWIPRAAEWRKKHLRYWPWYGRGLIQITFERNYKFAEDQLGVPLTKRPELALDDGIAIEIAVTGMREGWFTGKKLSDYVTLEKSSFVQARRIVNGMDKARSIADLAKLYDAALKAEHYN